MAEWRKIITLIKEGRMTADQLLHNGWNAYYPSYVLHHHFRIFIKLLRENAKRTDEQTVNLIRRAESLEIVGAFFDKQMNCKTYQTGNPRPKIN